jgi:hypothetical protein
MLSIKTLMESAIAEFGSETKLAKAAGVAQASINEAKRKGQIGRCETQIGMRATSYRLTSSRRQCVGRCDGGGNARNGRARELHDGLAGWRLLGSVESNAGNSPALKLGPSGPDPQRAPFK